MLSIFLIASMLIDASLTAKLFTSPLEPVDHRFVGYNHGVPFQGYKLLNVQPSTELQAKLVYGMEDTLGVIIDFWSRPATLGEDIQVFVGPEHFKAIKQFLDQKTIAFKVVNHKIGDDVIKENAKHSGSLFNQYTGFDYTRYHNLHEIDAEVQSLAATYSNIATLVNIGTTHEGRTQQAIKISVKQDPSRKVFFFNCGMHAREWVTPATCMYMLREMLTKYNYDPDVTAMLDRMDWVILPVLNADGYAYTWQSSFNRMWRKTRTPNPRSSCIGVDPNRNWDIQFAGVGTSSNPCSDIYPGEYAFSEPCVVNVKNYIAQHKSNLAAYIDIHSFSQLWMTPWGYTKSYPKDYTELARVSKIAVDALENVHGTQYRYGPSSVIIYATSGASDDWVYENTWTRYSYGLELRDKGHHGFMLPAAQIIPTGEETFSAFKAMAKAMIL